MSIARDINADSPEKVNLFKKRYVSWIIKAYIMTFRYIPTFFGLRDFYCFIKEINRGLTLEGENPEAANDKVCYLAFKRNFSGSEYSNQAEGYFKREAAQAGLPGLFVDNSVTTTELIEANI